MARNGSVMRSGCNRHVLCFVHSCNPAKQAPVRQIAGTIKQCTCGWNRAVARKKQIKITLRSLTVAGAVQVGVCEAARRFLFPV
jgi:hypothetical protein